MFIDIEIGNKILFFCVWQKSSGEMKINQKQEKNEYFLPSAAVFFFFFLSEWKILLLGFAFQIYSNVNENVKGTWKRNDTHKILKRCATTKKLCKKIKKLSWLSENLRGNKAVFWNPISRKRVFVGSSDLVDSGCCSQNRHWCGNIVQFHK